MVLAELGSKISAALGNMSRSITIDEKVVDELINAIGKALLDADVNVRQVKGLQVSIKKGINLDDIAAGHNKRKLIQQTVIKELYALLDPGSKPFVPKKGEPNVVMFVGLQGSGKTTRCTKYAAWYKKKGFKVALICADTYRAGAYDQLKQNAIRAGVPYYGSYSEADPAVLAEAGVEKFKEEKFDMIIVDTSGRHKQQTELFAEMQQVAKACSPDEIVFVMDSSIGQAAKDQAQAFRDAVAVGSVIITKLDGHAKGGGALSAVAVTKSPIVFVGTGEHIDDFEPFNTKSFVQRLLGMGDIDGLLGILSDEKLIDKQKESALLEKLRGGGDFTFRDMYEQFQMLMNIGSLGKVMSMIPGFSNMMGKNTEEESVKRIKRFMTIMDSMTAQELDSDNKIFNTQPSRVTRIAMGAGVSIRAVHEVLETFKPFQKVVEGMRNSGLADMDPSAMMGGKGGRGRGRGMPNMRQLSQMLGPQMQRGGMGAQFQNIMRQMSSGGMPDLSALMGQMGGMMGGGGMPGMGRGR